MSMLLRGFYVIQCTKCGEYGSKEIRGATIGNQCYKCVFCNTMKKLKRAGKIETTHNLWGPYRDERTATKVAQQLKEQGQDLSLEFTTYYKK